VVERAKMVTADVMEMGEMKGTISSQARQLLCSLCQVTEVRSQKCEPLHFLHAHLDWLHVMNQIASKHGEQ